MGCIKIRHIMCRSAYILYYIGHFDIYTTFTTEWKQGIKPALTIKGHIKIRIYIRDSETAVYWTVI